MKYSIEKTINYSFEEAVERVTEELKKEGFGVLTEIDVQATLKLKLDVDFEKYKILGACNPSYAYKALQADNKIGTMLPCNIIVREQAPGRVEVAAVHPIASMMAVENPSIKGIASEITKKMEQVIAHV